jgi:hypothetical protein
VPQRSKSNRFFRIGGRHTACNCNRLNGIAVKVGLIIAILGTRIVRNRPIGFADHPLVIILTCRERCRDNFRQLVVVLSSDGGFDRGELTGMGLCRHQELRTASQRPAPPIVAGDWTADLDTGSQTQLDQRFRDSFQDDTIVGARRHQQ